MNEDQINQFGEEIRQVINAHAGKMLAIAMVGVLETVKTQVVQGILSDVPEPKEAP